MLKLLYYSGRSGGENAMKCWRKLTTALSLVIWCPLVMQKSTVRDCKYTSSMFLKYSQIVFSKLFPELFSLVVAQAVPKAVLNASGKATAWNQKKERRDFWWKERKVTLIDNCEHTLLSAQKKGYRKNMTMR